MTYPEPAYVIIITPAEIYDNYSIYFLELMQQYTIKNVVLVYIIGSCIAQLMLEMYGFNIYSALITQATPQIFILMLH